MSLQSQISNLATRVGQEIKSVRTEFLSKTNTASYTPTADYHPATKKYVDDNAASGSDYNIDGGGASSVYLSSQNIDGGGA
jgi:hypothetical protein